MRTASERSDDLTVDEAAAALRTTPQTVRRLLRQGRLRGRQEPWGRRFVWVPSRSGVEELLSQAGAPVERLLPRPAVASPQAPRLHGARARAAVIVVVLGFPLLVLYAAVQVLPEALWFREVGHLDVHRRIAEAKAELWGLTAAAAAAVIGVNLAVAVRRRGVAGTSGLRTGVGVVSVVLATFFASRAAGHWEAFLLWRNAQPFGVLDPVSGKDAGFFVFTLPFELAVSTLVLWLLVVAGVAAGLVYRSRGALRLRPLTATYRAQVHVGALAAAGLLVVAWRCRLERYALALGQPKPNQRTAFAGVDYVDAHVRSPGLAAASAIAIVAALTCLAAPHLARGGHPRAARRSVALPAAALIGTLVSVESWLPAAVQRFAVDPNPLATQGPYLRRSIAATRGAFALDAVDVHPYSPGTLRVADVGRARRRLDDVAVWDERVLQARMRDLVAGTPYFRPQAPTVDVQRAGRRPRLTMASAQQLDVRRAGPGGRSWSSDRLTYTHGMGLPRYSQTATTRRGQPTLLDAGFGVRQPRVYFGPLAAGSPPWVLADTRRAEADLPPRTSGARAAYHYTGTGGTKLSSWAMRALLALHFRSKELLLSDDITPDSRILMHRDVRERLATLAPFIRWDTHPAALSVDGRIVFLVEGYTTSQSYPDAEQVSLGAGPVSYARASVRATVDAFSGQVHLYLSGEPDPVARAWSHAFPSLLRPADELPAELRARLRYPQDLFVTQATAYQRFHTTRPDVVASGADIWSAPTSLSGSLDVAGDIQFDEDDEDDLTHAVRPAYKLSPPPGQAKPRLVLSTLFSPRRGQNLVGSLDGWVDAAGRPHLASRRLPRDRVTLGPAQVSRLVFATPRVSKLLGLTNLELRDLDKSSLDSVSLGSPRVVFLPRGIVQIQSLYQGTSGPGASRLIGVTAFVNGRAAVGSSTFEAVRKAMNRPPRAELVAAKPVGVGSPAAVRFEVADARREVVTITSAAGRQVVTRAVRAGAGAVGWVPSAAGVAHVRLTVTGMDGTSVTRAGQVRVLSRRPVVRLVEVPTRAQVGRRVRFSFEVRDALDELVQVSTRGGVTSRRYLLRGDDTGFFDWTPTRTGEVVVHVRARGRQGQVAEDEVRLTVVPARRRTVTPERLGTPASPRATPRPEADAAPTDPGSAPLDIPETTAGATS